MLGFTGEYGFDILAGAAVSSTGTPKQLTRVCYLGNIQEQQPAAGAGKFMRLTANRGQTEMGFWFTELSMPPGKTSVPILSTASGVYPIGKLWFKDCQLRGCDLSLIFPATDTSSTTVALTNNLLERSTISLTRNGGDVSVFAYNNLFYDLTPDPSLIALSVANNNAPTRTWYIRDNLFVGAPQSRTGTLIDSAHNGFSGVADGLSTVNPRLNLTADFVSGTLGPYYYRNTGSGFYTLVDAGSRPSLDAGLADYTTQTAANSKDTLTVDIGFHFAAAGANGALTDSDSDGLPDYWETYYALASQSASGLDGTYGDPDGDGLSNLQEYTAGSSPVENDGLANPLALPPVGARYLRIISSRVLELVRIFAEGDTTWNFDANPPAVANFQVTVDSSPQTPASVGFKRRPLYRSYYSPSDTRMEKALYLRLGSDIADNAQVQVNNTASLWPSSMQFVARKSPLRYGPAIHVNQDGYIANNNGVLASNSKKAKVGYYLGTASELQLSSPLPGFEVVDAATGETRWSSTAESPAVYLTARRDTGWNVGAEQYQNVLEADFSTFTTPGTYRLKVPGLGASFPFTLNDSVALKWARTYALGLYHQRCGNGPGGAQANALPFTRFVHENCHFLQAYIPNMNTSPAWPDDSSIIFHNNVIDEASNASDRYPGQTAQRLYNFNQSLYRFANIVSDPNSKITKDVSGGHHDAGDYSKYISNSGLLIHMLVFAADNLSGAADLNNLGIPESGGTYGSPSKPFSDLLQEAEWEADFLRKMKDPDGGFYFLVYPICSPDSCSRYEQSTPDRGRRQLLYPKTTCVTASAVAALAEIGSSPAFKARFPTEAAAYRAAALDGWNFLLTAFTGSSFPYADKYQRITHYGDIYLHQDELAWAAAAMFSAFAGDPANQAVATDAHQKFKAWLPAVLALPADYGPLFGGIGCAVRDYAFTVRSGRPLGSFSLDPATLTSCENTILNQTADWRNWSLINSYGVSLADALKRGYNPRWFFPAADAAYDLAVADRLMVLLGQASDPRYNAQVHADNVQAILENFNYQHGCNPLNLGFVTGLGWRREREIVHQYPHYPNYDLRLLPPSGVPYGTISFRTEPTAIDINSQPIGCNFDAFFYPYSGDCYGGQHACRADSSACGGTASFGLYDRWGDYHNVNREFVAFQTARALGAAGYVHSLSSAANNAWQKADGKFSFPNGTPALNSPTVVRLDLVNPDPTIDLNQAQITWDVEFEDQPAFGRTFTLKPRATIGATLVEAEAVLPDGRRVFGRQYLNISSPSGGTEFPDPPADSSTVALYHFTAQEPFADSSEHGYTLEKSGIADVGANAAWMSSPSGLSAKFTGDQDRLETTTISDSLLGTNGKFTVEARIYVKGYGTYANPTIFTLSQPDANGNNYNVNWTLYFDTATAPRFYGPKGQLLISAPEWSAAVTPNTWHSLKVTVDNNGTTTRIYIDGQPFGPFATNPSIVAGRNWTLSMGNFVGDFDEVRVSNTLR